MKNGLIFFFGRKKKHYYRPQKKKDLRIRKIELNAAGRESEENHQVAEPSQIRGQVNPRELRAEHAQRDGGREEAPDDAKPLRRSI